MLQARQEDEDRRVRQETTNLARIVENETGGEEDTEGTGDERDIWSVSHVTEEDFDVFTRNRDRSKCCEFCVCV